MKFRLLVGRLCGMQETTFYSKANSWDPIIPATKGEAIIEALKRIKIS